MSHTPRAILLLSRLSLVAFLLVTVAVFAQETQETSEEAKQEVVAPTTAASNGDLAKATQNPIASLISVPIQNNTNFNFGPAARTQDVLQVSPVIPVKLSADWNLVTRIIQPIVWQPYPTTSTGGQYGFDDMNPSFFLVPAKPSKLIWGFGPTFILPTATNSILGQGKLSMGPGFVALTQPGPWTLGVLANK